MTYGEAKQMVEAMKAVGMSDVKINHVGFWSQHSPALDVDGKWEVHVWYVSARAGNRNLEITRDFAPDMAPAIARRAQGRATKRDQVALARIAAAREMDRE